MPEHSAERAAKAGPAPTDPDGSSSLQVRDLAVTLGQRPVLRGVSLTAAPGTITALLGPNGAGKTTLLRAVLGLIPYRGAIALGQTNIAQLSPAERATRIAYLPQRSRLEAPLRVATVVEHGRYAHARSARLSAADRRAVAAAMDAADIADLAERPFARLSGGEQRRVLLARALATGARVLVLDEPAASLDIGHVLAMYALLARLRQRGLCIVVAMHDLADAARHADRAVLLDRGQVAASGPSAEVVAAEPIRRVYGVDLIRRETLDFRLPPHDDGDGDVVSDAGTDTDTDAAADLRSREDRP
ncbi:MAG: ABC transporter ATP-binding protein [Myxococcota bacterium]